MNKLAVITGGTRGIGRAVAHRFAQSGFNLLLTARSEANLLTVKSEIETLYNVHCFIFPADLSNKAEALALCEFVNTSQTHLDVLINNTGVFLQGSLMTEDEQAFETQMHTNVYSAYWVTRGLINLIKKAPYAHIFNVCSIASLQAYSGSGSYTVSKFALLGFSKSLREELKKDKIKVTSIMPGATFTSSWAGVDLPPSRFIQAEDIAETIWAAYSLSPSALVEDIVIRPIEGDL